jgi:hypothetical protein
MVDLIILALLTGAVTLIAMLLYPQPIRWSDEPVGAGQGERADPASARRTPLEPDETRTERPAPRSR